MSSENLSKATPSSADAHESVDAQIARVLANIERRASTLERDALQTAIVDQRVFTSSLAAVSGFESYVKRANIARKQANTKEEVDAWSHSQVSRGDLLSRYPTPSHRTDTT